MDSARKWVPTWWDVAVAVTVGAAVLTNSVVKLSTPHPTDAVTVFGLVSATALLARTRLPITVLLLVGVCGVLPTLVAGTYPDFYASFVPSLVAIYVIALQCLPKQAALVPVVGTVFLISCAARAPSFLTIGQLVFTVTGIALAFGAGRTMRLLRSRADVEAARADLLIREHDVQAREAVAAERERIARELHDVIAHDVAVMVVQAGAAERVFAHRPALVAESLAQIQASGRKAIDELHLLLGMLREDERASAARPGLLVVGELVAELNRTGLPVTLTVSGQIREVGEAVDVSAYRIVQEALTNVLKHSAGSHTNVAIDYGRADLTIRVTDDGDGPRDAGTALPSAGYGLAGMRERARLFGGTLATGARPAGGWAITATLPIPSPA